MHIHRQVIASVDSTNTRAKQLAAQGAPEGTLIVAHEQTAGRGRHGNVWQSLSGNLFASVILRPAVAMADVGQLSFLIAVALAEALEKLLPQGCDLGVKWPNDILLNGRKCAGILLESEAGCAQALPWVVAGMGVNLVVAPEGAVSLSEAGADAVQPEEFLDLFEPSLAHWYACWQAEGFAPLQAAWSCRAINRGKEIRVRLTREDLSGIFEGIDERGALQLRLADDNVRLISSGEVYL